MSRRKSIKPTREKKICDCLICKKLEVIDGIPMIICEEQACYLNCDQCTDKPRNQTMCPKYYYWQKYHREERRRKTLALDVSGVAIAR